MDSPNKGILKGAVAIGTGNIIGQILAFIFLSFLARILSKSDYGEIQYILNLANLAAIGVAAGLPTAMTKFLAQHKDSIDVMSRYFTNTTLIFIAMLVLTEAVVLIIFGFNFVICMVVLGYSVPLFYSGVVRGQMDYLKFSVVSILTNIVKLSLLFTVFYYMGVTQFSVLVIYSFAGWFVILALETVWSSRLKFRREMISPEVRKEVLRFSLPVLATTITYAALSAMPIIFLERYWNYETVAVYSVALTLTTIYSFVPMAVLTMAMPKISSLDCVMSRIVVFQRTIFVIITSTSLLFVGTVLLGKWAISFIFTNSYAGAYMPLLVLSIGAFFMGARNAFSALWEGSGRPLVSTYDSIAGMLVVLVACAVFVPFYGPVGAAWAFVWAWVAAVTVDLFYYLKHFGKR